MTFIAVMGVRVADPTRSYLMVCSPDRPDCNTVYEIEYRYIPFASKEEVQEVSEQHQGTCLFAFSRFKLLL